MVRRGGDGNYASSGSSNAAAHVYGQFSDLFFHEH